MRDIINFLEEVEGFRLKAYKCSAGKWTIAIGNTFYKNGKPVKQGDRIGNDEALELAAVTVADFSKYVKSKVKSAVNPNQFTALVSFCYNIGKGAFDRSVILKMVNNNPNDLKIKNQFLISFITANGVHDDGLVNRRHKEANLYFTL